MKNYLSYDRVLTFLLCFYAIAIFTSMAALEISIWIMMVMILVGVLRSMKSPEGPKAFKLGIDWALAGLFVTVVLGWFFNREDGAIFNVVVGAVRWIVTLYGMTFILAYLKVPRVFFGGYVFSIFVASIYGFVTVYTKWDFIRGREVPFRLRTHDGEFFARAVSFLGSPMQLGHTFSLAVCMLAGVLGYRVLASREKNELGTAFLFLTLVLCGVCLIMTYTRGAWLAALAGLGVMLFLLSRRWFAIGAVAVVFLVTVLTFTSERFKTRAVSIFTTKENYSNMARIELWQMNLAMFRDHPIVGVGLNRNEEIVERYYIQHDIPDGFIGHAHSNYLQFLSGTGLVGCLFFMSFIGFYLFISFRLWKRIPADQIWHRGLLLGALGGQVALHVGGFTECNFKTMLVNHHFIFLVAIVGALNWMYPRMDRGAVKA